MEDEHTGREERVEKPLFTPSMMHGLLRAGTSGTTRALRHWEPPPVEDIHRALPQYEVTEFIARGGMGAVYKGVQKTLGRTVAIKILPPDIVDDEMDYAARFKREAQAMASLSHPNIVAVYEAGEVVGKTGRGGEEETGGQEAGGRLLYFVMEYIDGTDVAQMVAAHGRLPPEEAVRISTAVCAALECAHARGIIHRDIKPSNVLINERGEVKVADFGLAKFAADGLQSQSAVAVGTPDFLAPEAHLPGIVLDQRADLYSVGVMLYQMLTGKVPRGRFDPPSGEVPGIDLRMDGIIDKAMRTDRDKRYASATEMREALEHLTRSDAFQASARTVTAGSRHSLLLAGAVVLVIAGVAWRLKQSPTPSGGAVGDNAPPIGPSWSKMPTEEDKKLAFTNTLGMKFVPAPGTDVLFCIHETRKGDYAAYAAAVPGVDGAWRRPIVFYGQPVSPADDHPVVMVNLPDAEGFCTWLSAKEGRKYRLPTDHEWSCAVGIGEREDPKAYPADKSRLGGNVFAWGTEWPPPKGAGNIGDETCRRLTGAEPMTTRYDDAFATTAPVMSFAPNALGIYDLAGNVFERCPDWMDRQQKDVVGRGSSYNNGGDTPDIAYVTASIRNAVPPDRRQLNYGFRIVVER